MKSTREKVALAVAIMIIMFFIVGSITVVILGVNFLRKNVYLIKDSITSDKFITTMKNEGFDVTKIENTLEKGKYNIKEAYKAENDDYQVEFYTFKNDEDALAFFESSKKEVDSNIAKKEISLSGKNYSTYTIVKDGKYHFIERINDTVIVVHGSSKNEKDSKKLLENFGY